MIKARSLILTTLIFSQSFAFAQDQLSNQTYEGKWEQKVQTELEVFINEKRLGDFTVEFVGDKLYAFSDERLPKVLKRLLKKDLYQQIIEIPFPWVLENFPFEVKYDETSLKIFINFDINKLRPDFYRIENDPSIKYEGAAIEPAPLSGSLSVTAEQGISGSYFGGDYFSTSYNSFVNFHGYVLETQGFYEDRNQAQNGVNNWFRGNTRLVKDFVDERTRFTLGDTSTSNLGFMSGRNIGGVSLNREFSINPYERPFPQGAREFTVLSRSRVKTFVNGTLIKDEFLPAGNYQLSRLPLIDGINFVKVEIEDAFGEISVQSFDIPTSTQILKKGILDYNIALGKVYQDRDNKRRYEGSDIISLYGQYGFSDQYTGSFYAMSEEKLLLGGLINGLSTTLGNFFLEHSFSSLDQNRKGMANALTWQLQNSNYQGAFRLSSSLRFEDYASNYTAQYTDSLRPLDYGYRANFSLPLSSYFSLGVGVGQSTYQDESLGKRTSFNLTSNIRTLKNINLSVFASHTEEYNGVDSNALSFFMTWNFSSANRYLSAYHDVENKRSRLSVTQDNNNEMYRPRYNVNIEKGEEDTRVDTRINIPTPMADIALKGVAVKEESPLNATDRHFQGVATVGTSLLFAANDGFSFALSRSNNGSFAIFKPSEDISNDQIVIRSTSPFADTETPWLGDLAIPNLVDYQYRDVQIDPTFLNEGITLKDEQFILHSTYKSGHLLRVTSNGSLSLKGVLFYKDKPVAYKVIKIGDKVSFTDESGAFYFPGVDKEENLLEIQDVGTVNIEKILANKKYGIVDLGELNVKRNN